MSVVFSYLQHSQPLFLDLQFLLVATDKSRIIMFAANSGHQLRNFYGAINDVCAALVIHINVCVVNLCSQIYSMQSGVVSQQLVRLLHKPGSQFVHLGGRDTTPGAPSQGAHQDVTRCGHSPFDRRSGDRKF